jgi:hypothetical protein
MRPTDCVASYMNMKSGKRGGHSLRWAAEPEKIKLLAHNTLAIYQVPSVQRFLKISNSRSKHVEALNS